MFKSLSAAKMKGYSLMSQSKIWYVVMDGKAEGPHTEDEIRDNLKVGKLSYADLVFKPGLSRWVPVAECGEFERRTDDKKAGGESTANQINIPEAGEPTEKGWIILTKQKNDQGKSHYIQSGPFTTNQVKRKLEKDELKYTDHIWFKGYKSWQVISAIADFERRTEPLEPSPGIPKMSAGDIAPEDMATVIAPSPLAAATANDPSAPAKTKAEDDENTRNNLDKYLAPALKKTNRRKIGIAMTGATLGIALTYAALNAYKENSDAVRKVASVKTVVPARASAVPAPPSHATTQAINPELENRPPKKPSILKIVSLKTSTDHPQVVLESDLPGGTEINVHVKARAGSILKYPSYDLAKKLTVIAGQLPSIDFTKDQLPWGDYTLSVAGGDLSVTAPFSIGERTTEFQKRLKTFQAQVALQRKKEKSGLTDGLSFVSRSYASLTAQYKKTHGSTSNEAKKKWTIMLRTWRKDFERQSGILKRVDAQNRNFFVYPDTLLKLKEVEQQLWDVTQLYDKSLKTGRSIASVDDMDQTFTENLNELKNSVKKIK
jgi:hypothetical protein